MAIILKYIKGIEQEQEIMEKQTVTEKLAARIAEQVSTIKSCFKLLTIKLDNLMERQKAHTSKIRLEQYSSNRMPPRLRQEIRQKNTLADILTFKELSKYITKSHFPPSSPRIREYIQLPSPPIFKITSRQLMCISRKIICQNQQLIHTQLQMGSGVKVDNQDKSLEKPLSFLRFSIIIIHLLIVLNNFQDQTVDILRAFPDIKVEEDLFDSIVKSFNGAQILSLTFLSMELITLYVGNNRFRLYPSVYCVLTHLIGAYLYYIHSALVYQNIWYCWILFSFFPLLQEIGVAYYTTNA